ncbi:RNA-directed DNA polymerase, eukaryota [Tanacetum coccineum]
MSLALSDPHWQDAMYDKYNALIKNSTWVLVPRPYGANIMRCLWLFRHKFHVDGSLSRLVVKPATIRTVLSLALTRHWHVHQLDIKNAFLNGYLSETVYMHQPPGFVDSRYPHHVCRLQRSLYGLKQAPRAWFHRFVAYATRVGFSPSRCDSSLLIYRSGTDTTYLLIYVDDIVLTASSRALLHKIIFSLHKQFDMTDLGALNYFLRIFVTRDTTGMILSQKKYDTELLKRAHMLNYNPTRTPVDTESKLGPEGTPISDPTLYRSLAGGLQYLTFTRPNLSYVVQQICLYMHDPWEPHLTALKRILRYVQGTLKFDLHPCIVYLLATIFYHDLQRDNRLFHVLVQKLNIGALLTDVYLSANPVQHQRTKHIEIDIHFVRDMVAIGHVRALHVPSRYQYADIFTKGLPSALFEEFRTSLSVRLPPAQTAGEWTFGRLNATPIQKDVLGSNGTAPSFRQPKIQDRCGSYVHVVNGNNLPPVISPSPAMVLDDSCVGRIVWVDIEGVPIHAWSCATFNKIGSKWGEVMEHEESKDDLAKELFMWSPTFKVDNESKFFSDEDSTKDSDEANGGEINKVSSDIDSDGEAVSDTYFGENNDNLDKEHSQNQPQNVEVSSLDPFNIYESLHKKDDRVTNKGSENSIPFPPGFTPVDDYLKVDEHVTKDKSPGSSHRRSEGFCSRVMEDCQQNDDQPPPDNHSIGSNGHALKKGGSILEVLDGMVKVGQAMGYDMGGCLGSKAKKDWTRELIGKFDHISSDAIGNSGGILYMWDTNVFLKEHHTISDDFVAVTGDFNEVRSVDERGHDRHLSDHRLILLREVQVDYGATPFHFYHLWLNISGFDLMVSQVWNSFSFDDNNDMIRFKKKLQALKSSIREWIKVHKKKQMERRNDITLKLSTIDQQLDQGIVNDDILLSRMNLMKQLHDIKSADSCDVLQKAKIKWAVEGDENTKFFHGIVNRKRANLAIKGIMVDGDWIDVPSRVKDEFVSHFASRFQAPCVNRSRINFSFPNRLNSDESVSLEMPITSDEIRSAVWACGENKSPGPDGFTFEFFRRFWDVIGPDFCLAVKWFFDHNSFAKGCNSSFIALIPKVLDPKFVNDYRPISLIGSLYKVVTKILAIRLSSVLDSLISEVQSAFLPNRQILDGPFVINEVLSWCKHKRHQAMIFKVDFAKAYDSVRWDFLDDVLLSFGFGLKWRSWILGSLSSGKASVLVNGSPTSEFQFHCGLKQGDPLAPYLFILVMESLHLSFARVVEAGIFKGLKLNNSVMVSHLFYADDAVFVGEWSESNLSSIMNVLHCFSLTSGLKINVHKSHLLGVGVPNVIVDAAASSLGCSIMKTPFMYLGVPVGGNMSNIKAWDDIIRKIKSRLSKWKVKTLSIGGRLTLLKSVLGSTPIYWMSLYKVPKAVLASMEAIRRKFFNGAHDNEEKISWVKWSKVLSPKKHGGLGVSSFYALNRALLFKWVWRYISQDNSLWARVISSIHGSKFQDLVLSPSSLWISIVREVRVLKSRGVDLVSYCKKRVGNGLRTSFWEEVWIGDNSLSSVFPRIFALENNKSCSVADKLHDGLVRSLRRQVRGGVESQQLSLLHDLISSTLLSNVEDRWVWNLNGSDLFRVSDIRNLVDETFLPKDEVATRWIKYIPIKINIFAWKVRLDRLPTRLNLVHRGVQVTSLACPVCSTSHENTSHILFSCSMASDIARLISRWWDLGWSPLGSYDEWLSWFKDIRMGSKLKSMLE